MLGGIFIYRTDARPEDRHSHATCKAGPLHGLSGEVVSPKIKRGGIEPIISTKPEPGTDSGTEPLAPDPNAAGGPGTADPLSGGQPIVVKPDPAPAPAPAPPAPPKPATAPDPAPASDPTTDQAIEPLGNPKGNDDNFNGYAVTGPNKAVTALNEAIRTNKPDVQSPSFDVQIEDAEFSGQKFPKYKRSKPIPAPDPGQQVGFNRDPADFLNIKAERLQDPDVNLPTVVDKATGGEDLGAKWATVRFSSSKGPGTRLDNSFNTVADVSANQDGSAIVVSDTNASKDFNNALTDAVPDVNKKSPSSELIAQAAGLVRDPNTASALRVIVRKSVINKGATNTLKQAYESLGLSLDEDTKGVFRASAAKDTPEGKAFDALMQVKNTEVTNFLLADHHQLFGDKVIQEIVSFLNSDFDGGSLKHADIFFILGKN